MEGSKKWSLPHGSILAFLLFNIYTNYQPAPSKTTIFLYADDIALFSQAVSFEEVEEHLSMALDC